MVEAFAESTDIAVMLYILLIQGQWLETNQRSFMSPCRHFSRMETVSEAYVFGVSYYLYYVRFVMALVPWCCGVMVLCFISLDP